MSEDMLDYIANIMASAVLSTGNEKDSEILLKQHEEVLQKILK